MTSPDSTEPAQSRRSVMARDACLVALVGTPTLVWYGAWRFASASLAVAACVALAVGCAATLIASRLGHTRKMLVALGLLALSVALAALTGRAQDYFLPGILVDALYAVVLSASVALRRPLIGVVLRAVAGRWRFRVPGSKRVHALLTLLWAARFAAEAFVMTVLYLRGDTDVLLVARFVLRAPLQIACAAVTLAVLAHGAAQQRKAETDSPKAAGN
ncbi:DUF3159 domain-containing protein [Streptomyces sp. NBC_00576]|uniref:DUF3159 domain-containing protein n=1 Tax=Streptomyces sp. NBC_00576 TaxID=2903665 RepID=UPI002E80D19B|nr:DUF3159 domain-containing protein [Streptomyces sp. NBC_00576]WUB73347.1 DUF3159 domain-containing protein [Streptomyces sp. NBC_00576]